MKRTTMTLLVTGAVGPHTVIADEAVEELADRLRSTEGAKITVRGLDGRPHVCPIDRSTVELVKLGDGRQALRATVELPDEVEIPPPPAALSGRETTEEQRAEAMPILERQATEGNPQ